MGRPHDGQNAMYDLSVGTTKGTNALLAFCGDEGQDGGGTLLHPLRPLRGGLSDAYPALLHLHVRAEQRL